jgi:hypothetical protein
MKKLDDQNPDIQKSNKPFRFYDNRQKYLMFVTTCGEKWASVERIDHELSRLQPSPPAIRIFDAGVGDGTVLSGVLRRIHQRFPHAPVLVVGKEISLEDVRLAMDKIADRLVEHPETVFVFTNLYFYEAPYLQPKNPQDRAQTVFRDIRLDGFSSYEYERQIKDVHEELADLWQVAPSPVTGNPRYVTPTVVTISRSDRAFTLEQLIPKTGDSSLRYDLALAAQPYRARLPVEKKVDYVLAPLANALAPNGVLIGIQSTGRDPGLEIVREIWPEENPFQTPGPLLTRALLEKMATVSPDRNFRDVTDNANALFRYRMHTMPSEVDENIGTSTLLAAWNAAAYVAQIEDSRLTDVMSGGADYIAATRKILERYGGLWFTNEAFVVQRKS